MSSDMFVFDEPYYPHLATTDGMISPEEISSNFFTDPLSTFSDSSIDSFLQEISDDPNNNSNTTQLSTQISTDDAQSLDQITHAFYSDSPPSHQLETLSIQQQTHLGNLSLGNNGYNDNYSVVSEIKTEDFQLGFDYPPPPGSYNSYFLNGGDQNMLKFMQRSYSSNSFEGKPGFLFQPSFDTLMEVQNFHGLNSPEIDNTLPSGHMRRVCSTGDIPVGENTTQQQVVCSSSPLATGGGEGNFMEEGNFKVGRYSAEERKERIDRYRAKRTQRNFNKTIKYACRKTLADNRPRIRGRFARNDETGEIPKPTCYHRYEDEDDLWVDNSQEEDEEGILGRRGGRFLNNFGATQLQYCGY